MPDPGTVIGAVGVLGGLKGASQQQAAAGQAAALSREQLEIYKKVVDAYLKELEEVKPYRQALRQIGATRMTWAPSAWGRWTSDPWRLTPDLPPISTMLNPPSPPNQTPPSNQPPNQGHTIQCPPGYVWNGVICIQDPREARGEGPTAQCPPGYAWNGMMCVQGYREPRGE